MSSSSDTGAADAMTAPILDAAAALFAEHGYSATSIDQIAERIGSTKGRVYHHYDAKAELVLHIQNRVFDDLIATLQPIAADLEAAPGRLGRMIEAHLILAAERPHHMQLAFNPPADAAEAVSALDAQLLAEMGERRETVDGLYSLIIRAGVREGHFAPLPTGFIRTLVYSVLEGAIGWFARLATPEPTETMRIVEAATRFVENGLADSGADR